MIKVLLPLLLIVFVSKGYGQDYLDEITKKTCSCAEVIPENLETEQFNIQLGACMLEASSPYKNEIKKDYDVDLDNIATEGAKWGRVVGAKLASVCPDMLVKISKSQKTIKNPEKKSTGVITKIENDPFIILSLKDESGKIVKFHWLSFITSDEDLIATYSKLTGKTVELSYADQDLFDPKIGEYRSFHIISKISLLKK